MTILLKIVICYLILGGIYTLRGFKALELFNISLSDCIDNDERYKDIRDKVKATGLYTQWKFFIIAVTIIILIITWPYEILVSIKK